MRPSIHLPLAVAALMAALAGPARAALFSPGFAGPGLDAGLVVGGSPGTSYSVGGGTLTLSQAAGQGNGDISVLSNAPVSGDFTATVTAFARDLGRADLGIQLGTADWSFTLADVFLNGTSGTVNGNIFQPDFNGAFLPVSTDLVSLTITRVGDTISDIFDAGAGPVVINTGTDPSLAVPINIGLFLLEAAGDTGAHSGSFVHLSLASAGDTVAVPEPMSAVLLGAGVMALLGLRRRAMKRTRGWYPVPDSNRCYRRERAAS